MWLAMTQIQRLLLSKIDGRSVCIQFAKEAIKTTFWVKISKVKDSFIV
jgi:hypothetical protein